MEAWSRREAFPGEWNEVDLLAACEFWSDDVQDRYVEDLKGLIEQRAGQDKATILTTKFDMKCAPNVPEEFYNVIMGGIAFDAEDVSDVEDRCTLIQWASDRFGMELPSSSVRQIATRALGSSGSIIEQAKRVSKFAAENAAVPLTGNVIDYALKHDKA